MADEPPRPPAARPKREPRCPVCGKPSTARHRPFCSARCAQVDLGRWLSGNYVIQGEAASTDPGEDKAESP